MKHSQITFPLLLICAVFYLRSSQVLAADLYDISASELTLDQAIQIAVHENRDLQAGRFIIKESQARLAQAGLWPNPEIEFASTTDKSFANEGEYAISTGFKQRLPISGRLSKSESLARVDVAIAIAEIQDRERLLVGEVRKRARELVLLDEKITVNQELQKSTRKLMQMLESRYKLAEISETELTLEKLELQRLILAAATTANERNAACASLNALLGRAPAQALKINGSLYDRNIRTQITQLAHEALKLRPDRRMVELSIDRSAAEVILARASRWEDWTVGFDYDKDRSVFTPPIGSKEDQFIGVSLSIPLPLWNQNDAKILEHNAAKSRARAELAAIDLKIETELLTSQSKLLQLDQILSTHAESSVALAKSNLALLEKSYIGGLVAITSLIQGQQQLSEIRTLQLDTKRDFLLALSEFETAAVTTPLLTFNEVQ